MTIILRNLFVQVLKHGPSAIAAVSLFIAFVMALGSIAGWMDARREEESNRDDRIL